MATIDLARACIVATTAARAAGALIRANFSKPRSRGEVTDKSVASIDLVTDTDKACEELIIAALRAEFPAFEYLGEEAASTAGSYALSDAPTWIVDPVDGTTNFVHRAPEVMVSIGLSVAKNPVVGVAYDPFRDEMFTSYSGGGAFLNAAPITVDFAATELCEAVVGSNLGYRRDDDFIRHALETQRNLLKANLRGMRMSGAAVYGMCSVAAGRSTCFYESGPHPWDACAAACLVVEAGGVALDMSGGPLDLCSRRYLMASSPAIADKVRACFSLPIPQYAA